MGETDSAMNNSWKWCANGVEGGNPDKECRSNGTRTLCKTVQDCTKGVPDYGELCMAGSGIWACNETVQWQSCSDCIGTGTSFPIQKLNKECQDPL